MSGNQRVHPRRRSVSSTAQSVGLIEALEDRRLLSASIHPNLTVLPAVTSTTPYGYTPAQIARHTAIAPQTPGQGRQLPSSTRTTIPTSPLTSVSSTSNLACPLRQA